MLMEKRLQREKKKHWQLFWVSARSWIWILKSSNVGKYGTFMKMYIGLFKFEGAYVIYWWNVNGKKWTRQINQMENRNYADHIAVKNQERKYKECQHSQVIMFKTKYLLRR